MKNLLILIAMMILSKTAFLQAPERIIIKGFGETPIVKQDNDYLVDFGKKGAFVCSGSLSPLNLKTKVSLEQLKEMQGYKIFSNLGLQDIELSISSEGLQMQAKINTKKNLEKLCKSFNITDPEIQINSDITSNSFSFKGELDFSKKPIVIEIVKNQTFLTLQKFTLSADIGVSYGKKDEENEKKKLITIDESIISVKTEMQIKPTKWDKNLKLISLLSYDLVSHEIKGAASMTDSWVNPLGLSNYFKKDVIVLTNTAIELGWIPGTPSFSSIGFYLEKAKFFHLEFSIKMSLSPTNGDVAFEASNKKMTLNDIPIILRDGFGLNVPNLFPENIFIENVLVKFAPSEAQIGEFKIEQGFALSGHVKFGDIADAKLDFYTNWEKGFYLDLNLDANFKNAIMKELKNVKVVAPIMKNLLSTLEVKKVYLHLEAGKDLVMSGKTYCKLSVLNKNIEFDWSGKFDPKNLVNEIVNRVKDIATRELEEISKKVSAAVVSASNKSKKIASDAWKEADKLVEEAKTASKHATHTQGRCDKECVPKHAKKLYAPLKKGSVEAIDMFYENVIRDVVNINCETVNETVQLRSQYLKTEWDNLTKQIDADWKKIHGDKTYIRFYLLPSSATDGGHRFRKIIDEEIQEYINYRNIVWNKMMTQQPDILKKLNEEYAQLPAGKCFYIQSAMNYKKNNGGFWDMPGNPQITKGLNINIWDFDNGNDRKYYLIPSSHKGYYEIAPGNSPNIRVDIEGGAPNLNKNAANIATWEKNNGNWQQFRFKHLGNGKFKIYTTSGMVICLANRNNSNGSNVHIWQDHDGEWVEWYLIDAQTNKIYVPQL